MKDSSHIFAGLYREYANDFLTIGAFAEHHHFDIEFALMVVKKGRIYNEVKT